MSTSGQNLASSADKAEGSGKQTKEKLRSACDNCAGSKVRCTKEQPICLRCQRLGLECIYGPSQRRGKPPMIRRSSHTSLSGSVANDPNPNPSVAVADRLAVPDAAWISNRVDTETTYFPTPMELAAGGSWDTYPTLSAPEMASSYIPIPMPPPPSLPYEISSDSQVQSLSGSPYASFSSLQTSAFPGVSSVHLSANVSTNPCFNEASAALNALYCFNQRTYTPVTINIPMAAGGMNIQNINITSPSLEAVRAAVTTVTRLSTCDCTVCISDKSMPFLLVTIVSKILDILRSICIFEFQSSRTSNQYQQSATGQVPASQWPGATAEILGSSYAMLDAASSASMIRSNRQAIASGMLVLLETLEVASEQVIVGLPKVDDAMGTSVQHIIGDMLRQNVTNLRIALEAMSN